MTDATYLHPLCWHGEHPHERHAFRVAGIIRRCEGWPEDLALTGRWWQETGWTGR